MSDEVERVAMAMFYATLRTEAAWWDDSPDWEREEYRNLARAAIESIRKPTGAMSGEVEGKRVMPQPAIDSLTSHQVQCDMDGVMVQVSRQALDEVLAYLALQPPPSEG